MSVTYFARGFKKCRGVPPHRWLVEMRMEKAKDLLLNTKTPLAEVAVACGFVDQSHLTKTFVRATGNTPGEWRHERRIGRDPSDMAWLDLMAFPASRGQLCKEGRRGLLGVLGNHGGRSCRLTLRRRNKPSIAGNP